MAAFTITFVFLVQLVNRILINPTLITKLFDVDQETARTWSTAFSGLTQSLLFSATPYIFEVLANIEGSATSLGNREQNALLYFWCFFLISRYMGQIVWDGVLKFWEDGQSLFIGFAQK